MLFHSAAPAFEWSNTEIQYLHGNQFQEPFNPSDVGKHIITLQHADGHAYGRNYFFIDTLQSNSKDSNATEVYAEGYASLSLSKISQKDISKGIVRDINFTAGINYGYKSYPDYNVNPRVLLSGISLDFNLPGFAFLNVDVLAFIDRGEFADHTNDCNASTYQITPAWKLPFSIGSAKFSFEGFTDFIGAHGRCASQILSQPQLRWDVGNHFGHPEKLFVGSEYQFWHNKYGIQGLQDNFPQTLLLWKF